jgi:hypothetical protein
MLGFDQPRIQAAYGNAQTDEEKDEDIHEEKGASMKDDAAGGTTQEPPNGTAFALPNRKPFEQSFPSNA